MMRTRAGYTAVVVCLQFTVYSIFAMSWTTMQCDGAGLANGTYPGRFRFRLVRFRGVLGADTGLFNSYEAT
jgi:hypothetical protein